jgi:hypothetical protein
VVDGMTPLDVVVRILNNQLSSLMWIDDKVSTVLYKSMAIAALIILISYYYVYKRKNDCYRVSVFYFLFF